MSKELVLHNINNLLSNYRSVQRRLNRFVSLEILCSIVLIALASGIISVDKQIRFLGVNININSPVLLITGMWAICILFICIIALADCETSLSREIKRLYESLEYRDHSIAIGYYTVGSLYGLIFAFLNSSKSKSFIFTKIIFVLYIIVMFIALLLLPFVAEFFAGYKLITILGWPWWLIVSHSLILCITVCNPVILVYYSVKK